VIRLIHLIDMILPWFRRCSPLS